MENINFSLNEITTETKIYYPEETVDTFLLDYTNVEELKAYYNTNYTLKSLSQILQYYGIQKNKMVKDEVLQVLLFFEMDPGNRSIVEKRMRLWHNIQELKRDSYFSKYILFTV